MRDTIINGKTQTFAFPSSHPTLGGVAKGAAQIAKERGHNITGLKKDQIIQLLANDPDFKNEKNMLEKMTHQRGWKCLFLPKFHCEFNPAELVWANSKRYVRGLGEMNFKQLEKAIPISFTTISKDTYFKTYQHGIEEIFASWEGMKSNIKPDVKTYKSHRRSLGEIPWKHLVEGMKTDERDKKVDTEAVKEAKK
jgi:transposase